MPDLVLGPLLRYVSEREATLWVETDRPCEVEVLGHRARTFHANGHHYALVVVTGLAPASTTAYEVALDGERRWPPEDSTWPPSVIRTLGAGPLRVAFGSCRVALPHEPPYTLTLDQDPRGREVDALRALALRMRDQPHGAWPHLLIALGDQVYADELSPTTAERVQARRGDAEPQGEVADFEEYTWLYHETWGDEAFRWLASTVSVAMIFDDHDIRDDWNTSRAWLEQMRATPWWEERIAGGLASYWVYQQLGNLSPLELERDELYAEVRDADDAGPLLRAFALRADRSTDGARWSYTRELGPARLVVVDSRAGRVLTPDHREMLDAEEWRWLAEAMAGDVDHLLIATSLPLLNAAGIHYVEAWSEAISAGAWGGLGRRLGERVREAQDLEHWAAFRASFDRLVELIAATGAGRRGRAPASIVVLSGDVHHAYLARASFPPEAGVRSPVYQAVCSPVRNPLSRNDRRVLRALRRAPARVITRALARAAGVRAPQVRWNETDGPFFDNQIATLTLDGPAGTMRLEKSTPATELQTAFERRLA